MPSSCLVHPVAGRQFITENRPGHVVGGAGGDLRAVHAGCRAPAEYLNQVVDHRSRQGLCYESGFLSAVVVAATACAGHDEVVAQAQWAAEAATWMLRALGAKTDPLTGAIPTPSEATARRALAMVDATNPQRRSTDWVAAPRASTGRRARLPAVAIDGKSLRGAAADAVTRPQPLSAATHDGAIVTAQRQIPDKGSETTQLAALVAGLDLAETVVTVDAPHTQRATAEHLVSVTHADYILTITANSRAYSPPHSRQPRGRQPTYASTPSTAEVTAAPKSASRARSR